MTVLRDNHVHRVAASGLLLLAVILAACSGRDVPTAPSADAVALAPASFIGDRPYSWSLKCSGELNSSATWSWTAAGAPIAGAEVSATCSPSTSPISGAGTRPAAADGLNACVNGTCDAWTFDPTGPFKVHLDGNYQIYDFNRCGFTWGPGHHGNGNDCWFKATGTLNVDS